jgi:glutathione S-transferase
MTSELKPLNLYGGGRGPNPWKVAILLDELSLPYETTFTPYANLKAPEFEKVNPNGRVPALEDPNTGITIWESGAILEYLVEQYDKENKFSFPALSAESYQAKQWLHFQVSGQGPYYGQATWFKFLHSEKVPSAVERYRNEILRVSKVLDKHLEGKQYFVGDKFSFVDVAFFPWQSNVSFVFDEGFDAAKEFPHVEAWLNRLKARPAVVKAIEERTKYVTAA